MTAMTRTLSATTLPRRLARGQILTFREVGGLVIVAEGEIWLTRVGGQDELYRAGDRFLVEPGVVLEALSERVALKSGVWGTGEGEWPQAA